MRPRLRVLAVAKSANSPSVMGLLSRTHRLPVGSILQYGIPQFGLVRRRLVQTGSTQQSGRRANLNVIGQSGSACDSSAVEQQATLEGGPEVVPKSSWRKCGVS
jgi:hypothetical protein